MIIPAVIFVVVLGLCLLSYLTVTRTPREAGVIAGGGLLLRILFVIADHVLGLFGDPGDEGGYEATLWFVAEQWRSGIVTAPLHVSAGPGHGGYYEILYSTIFAPIYLVFGRSPVLVRLAMALFGAFVIVNVFHLARDLFDHRAGLYAGAITALFPYWIYLSGILYRDMLVVLFLSWMVLFLVRWQRTSDKRAAVFCLIAAGLALSLRLVNIAPVGVMLGVAVYTKYETSPRQMAYSGVAGALTVLLFLWQFGDKVTIDRLADRRLWLARENTAAYLTGIVYESLPELIAFTPIGMLYFALVPFPWQTPNFLSVIAIFQNLFLWYPVLALAILGARDALHRSGAKSVLPLVAFVLAGFFSYGLVEGNIGPAMRHRSQFQFVVFALAGVGLSLRLRIIASSKTAGSGPGPMTADQ